MGLNRRLRVDHLHRCSRDPFRRKPVFLQHRAARAANGHLDPYAVKLWCLGNEMDGPWQLGHVPADQYAIRAQQAAKMMRDVDRSIELVACGSCGISMPTYMEWDLTVLDYLGELADYVSLHRYVGNRDDDTPDYLAITNSIDRQIKEMDAVCRYVQAKRRSKKRAYLCFDEWNVWYKDRMGDGQGQFAPHLIEEVYNLEDALVVAEFLNSFVRHADSVKIANIAQIVNVIAPLLTRGDETLVLRSKLAKYPGRLMLLWPRTGEIERIDRPGAAAAAEGFQRVLHEGSRDGARRPRSESLVEVRLGSAHGVESPEAEVVAPSNGNGSPNLFPECPR